MIIMSGLHEFALPQVMHCKSSFESLGYSVIVCKGLGESSTCEQPPARSGVRTSVAWGPSVFPSWFRFLRDKGLLPQTCSSSLRTVASRQKIVLLLVLRNV